MSAVALRAGAHGLYADEAACELLISHASWLHLHDFTARFLHTGISITDGTDLAHIDWPAAITAWTPADFHAAAARERCSGSRPASVRASP